MMPASLYPDFYILGAQKSGTTSLCALLEQHPQLCLSRPKEPMILSRDDIALHPHFFAEQQAQWDKLDWHEHRDTFLKDYANCFAHATEAQLLGDGSTSYLYSMTAPERIKTITPNAKFIIILRDPVARAYSAYWHFVKKGLACEPFASHIRYEHTLTLDGSAYSRHIARWLTAFPREQFLFLCYEEMLENVEATATQLADFLAIDPWHTPELPEKNRGRRPKWLWLQLMANYARRRAGILISATGEETTPRGHPLCRSLIGELTHRNLTTAPPPPMDELLQARLTRYFRDINRELNTQTGLDTTRYWYQ
ncbi:MAG: hypothetical protein CMM93_00520 [Rickettsiales bacterium]|nr:hypothetical protein [Rickettsiales bacterium]|tara:strand:- start:2322 stop:3251 length:930 start_codon:yes stop_codon:yes gene_type:complete